MPDDPIALTCPTFWGPPSDRFEDATDQIYDHPIPIDEQGCLGRFLESVSVIEEDVDVVLVSSSSSTSWEEQVDTRIQEEIDNHVEDYNCYHFSHADGNVLREYIEQKAGPELAGMIDMYGSSEIRNTCLLACHILGYETIVSTDDDVVFDDPEYIMKAREYIGSEVEETGETAYVVCGPYCDEEGTIQFSEPPSSWMAYWNNSEAMNEVLDRYISGDPRLKETSYTVMGNIVLHRNFFSRVPLDPGCHRGEEMDWLINARIFGFRFYMDRELCVQHKPPRRRFPMWKLVRLDIERFLYDRRKIRQMESNLGIPMDYFDPWPGRFFKEDLEERIYRTNMMLSNQYLANGESEHAEGCLNNIFYSKHEYNAGDPLDLIQAYQTKWQQLMGFVEQHREELSQRIFGREPIV